MPRDVTYELIRGTLTNLVTTLVQEVERRQLQAHAEGRPIAGDTFAISTESGPVGIEIHNLSLHISDAIADAAGGAGR
jgi:hypothetical protein